MTPKGQIIKGYKATDQNMCCRGFQFELEKWYDHNGDVSLCESGFHFCEYPSGPWAYYSDGRVFECEAELAILSTGPGADLKHVSKRIRLIKEINIGGNRNTGNQNTGNRNTGNRNTGNQNTGNGNTGDGNTGDGNTGYGNTGNGNTGYGNTGDWNTGDGNTGDGNTGNGNCGRYNSGDLCIGDAPYLLFGLPAERKASPKALIYELSELLTSDNPIDPVPYLLIPNATAERIEALHKAHIAARNKAK